MENEPVSVNLGPILPQRASVTHILMSKATPVWALGGRPKYQMRGVEVIGNLGDRSQGGSTRHAHPIVVAQRLRGAQNGGVAQNGSRDPVGQVSFSAGGCRRPSWDMAPEAPGRREGHSSRPLGGFKGRDLLLFAPPRDTSHLCQWRRLGCLCQAGGAAANCWASHCGHGPPPPGRQSQAGGGRGAPRPRRRGPDRDAHAP